MELVLGGELYCAAKMAVDVADAKARDRGEEKENFLIPVTSCMEDFDALASLEYSDLETSSALRRQVMATLVVNRMLGLASATGPRLLDILGGELPCPQLIEWLKGDPCGPMSTDMIPEIDEEDEGPLDRAKWQPDRHLLAYLYAHTKNFSATNIAKLVRITRGGYGVLISRPPDSEGCRLCKRGRTEFPAGELSDLPALPRHWGCRCFYAPLL